MKRGPSKGCAACLGQADEHTLLTPCRYIKELADRLVTLENQIQNPHHPPQAYDYPGVADPGLSDAQVSAHMVRKRTHSMSEGLHDSYGRPGWSGQDRGTPVTYGLVGPFADARSEDFSTNGQPLRRTSFSDMALASNLITGSNDGTIKA